MKSRPVISISQGSLGIDIDVLADHLGMTTHELKNSMRLLAMSYIINEAQRLNAGECFAKNIFPPPPIRDTHIIAAARSMLSPTTEFDG